MARVPYRDPEDVPEEYRDLMDPVNPFLGDEGGEDAGGDSPWDGVRNTHRAIANNPRMLEAYRRFAAALWTETGLPTRERELVILGVARGLDSAYEFHQHAAIALDGHLSEAEVRAVAGRDYGAFGDREAALLEYAVAFAERAVDGERHERLLAHYDESALIGIGMLAAYYVGIDHLGDAIALDLEEPFVGWDLSGWRNPG